MGGYKERREAKERYVSGLVTSVGTWASVPLGPPERSVYMRNVHQGTGDLQGGLDMGGAPRASPTPSNSVMAEFLEDQGERKC